jgi:Protein of unknown function (DUF2442)
MGKPKWEIRKIRKIEPTSDFELICTFDNGLVKQYDVKPLFMKSGPILEPLRKAAYFKRVFLEMGAPTWPNGFDICADLIYMEAIEVNRTPKRTKKPAE